MRQFLIYHFIYPSYSIKLNKKLILFSKQSMNIIPDDKILTIRINIICIIIVRICILAFPWLYEQIFLIIFNINNIRIGSTLYIIIILVDITLGEIYAFSMSLIELIWGYVKGIGVYLFLLLIVVGVVAKVEWGWSH